MIAPERFVVLADYVDAIVWAYEDVYDVDSAFQTYGEEHKLKVELPSHTSFQLVVESSLNEMLCMVPELFLYSPAGILHKVSHSVLSQCFVVREDGSPCWTYALFHVDQMRIDLSKLSNLKLPFESHEKTSGFLRDKLYLDCDLPYRTDVETFMPLDGFYLTVPEGSLPAIENTTLLNSLLGKASEREEVMQLDQVRLKLMEFVESGQFPRREQFRLQYASDMKIDAFKAIWRDVSRQHPQLSRPGPKPKSKS
jgi:hypothetical protein